MPIYEYRCSDCGKRSSSLLSSYAAPDPRCPHCGKAQLKRLVSTFATVRGEGGSDGDDFGGGEGDAGSDDDGGGGFDSDDDDY